MRERLARVLNCSSRCRLLLCCCASTGAGAASSHTYIHMKRESKTANERQVLTSIEWHIKGMKYFFPVIFPLWTILSENCWHFGGNVGHTWDRESWYRGVYTKATCLLSPHSVCWWLLCLSSYRFLKEAITNSFSSWSLLGRALWNIHTHIKLFFFLLYFLFNPGPAIWRQFVNADIKVVSNFEGFVLENHYCLLHNCTGYIVLLHFQES